MIEPDHQFAAVAHGCVVDRIALPRRQSETGIELHIAQHTERQRQHHRIVVALHAASGDVETQPHAAVGEFAHRHQPVAQTHRRGQTLGQAGRDPVVTVDHMEAFAALQAAAGPADLCEFAALVAVDEAQEADRTQFVDAGAVLGGISRTDDLAQQAARALQAEVVVQAHQVEQFVRLVETVGGGIAQRRQILAHRIRERAVFLDHLRFGIGLAIETIERVARLQRDILKRQLESAGVAQHGVMRTADELGAALGHLPREHPAQTVAAAADASGGFEHLGGHALAGQFVRTAQAGHAGAHHRDVAAAGNHPPDPRSPRPGARRHRTGRSRRRTRDRHLRETSAAGVAQRFLRAGVALLGVALHDFLRALTCFVRLRSQARQAHQLRHHRIAIHVFPRFCRRAHRNTGSPMGDKTSLDRSKLESPRTRALASAPDGRKSGYYSRRADAARPCGCRCIRPRGNSRRHGVFHDG